MLIPQAVAYAGLAGLPPAHGLYAAMLAPIAAAFFVSSPYLQTGPVAMTSVLTFGALAGIATPFTAEYVGLAALLALIVGVIRTLVGVLRAGFIADLLSQPVLNGFTAGAAILICLSQLPEFFGVERSAPGVVGAAFEALQHPGAWSRDALLVASTTVVIIVGGRRLHPLFPGVLTAVVLGMLVSRASSYEGALVGALPRGLPQLSLDMPWSSIGHLLVPGAVIALVGFAEPAAIARTIATQTRQAWSADREFVSQGAANIAAAVSGGFPVGGAFARTFINRAAGGRTRWSGAVTGLCVLAFLPFADILSSLPRAVLAGIVLAAAAPLADPGPLLRTIRFSPLQASVGCTTFALTLILSPRIDIAVLAGVSLSVGVHLWRERLIEIDRHYRDGVLTLEPVGVLYFGSAAALDNALIEALAEHPETASLVLDLRTVGRIDYSGALVLRRVAEEASSAGLEVEVLPGQVPQGRRVIERIFRGTAVRLVKEPDG